MHFGFGIGNRSWIGGLLCAGAACVAVVPVWADITDAPRSGPSAVKVETVASGLAHPWGLQFLDDGRFLVTERPGRLRVVGADGTLSEPISGVPKVHARGQGGLLDVRLAGDFTESGTIYLSFAEPAGRGLARTAVARAKLVLEGNGGRLEDVTVIWRQKPALGTSHHFGSRIVLANDGSLFITTGDRGHRSKFAQDPSTTVGKVIRINPDGSGHKDNPKQIGWPLHKDWAPEVWSIGHRNIQGAVLDTLSGGLWTVEHGARGGDELNLPLSGANYGWAEISYGRHYSGLRIGLGSAKEGMEQPVYYWDPSIATSGLEIYTGDLFAGWKGNLLVGGLGGAVLVRLVMGDGPDGPTVVGQEELLRGLGERVRDVRQGPDGAVYVLTDDARGALLRISPGQ